MFSKTINKKQNRRRFFLIIFGAVSFLAVMWLLTIFWGTRQIHQHFVQQERSLLTRSYTVFEDRQSLDKSVRWLLISDPWAPLPFIVSVIEDYEDVDIPGAPYRFYFFWCPFYHSNQPFVGRPVW